MPPGMLLPAANGAAVPEVPASWLPPAAEAAALALGGGAWGWPPLPAKPEVPPMPVEVPPPTEGARASGTYVEFDVLAGNDRLGGCGPKAA
mmetsp:Transcript_50699/g.147139  ORF Transcript_50699/g.147139 Transcript_50699/m.147139 type:complete len:91 (-) Transcript_50699:1562-1834(-)